jgi:hypothetical protein
MKREEVGLRQPWIEPTELGAVGRSARTDYDDLGIVGALDESLVV